MPYVKTIKEDGVVSDIMAKAIDPDLLDNDFTQTTAGVKALDAAAGKTLNDSLSTLDDAVVKKDNLVNGFTQTTAGVNALDAAAGKTLNDAFTNYSSINIATLSALNTFHSSIGNDAVRIGYVAAAVTQTLTGTYSANTNAFGIFRRADIYMDYFIIVAAKESYQGRYNTSTGTVSNVKKYVDASQLEKTTGTVASGGTATETVDFSISSVRMVFVGAGAATSSASDAMRAIAIIRNNAATGVLNGTSITISMSGTTLSIKNTGSGTVRYVID